MGPQFSVGDDSNPKRLFGFTCKHFWLSHLPEGGYWHWVVRSWIHYWHSAVYRTCMWTQSLRRVRLFVTPWTVTCQAPLSMELSWQEYWSGLPFLSPRDLPNPGNEHVSTKALALASGFFTTEPRGKPQCIGQPPEKEIKTKTVNRAKLETPLYSKKR